MPVDPVTTTGINWESVTTIVSSIVVIVGALTAWIGRQITHSINDLSEKLQLRLETKETVAAINMRLVAMEQTVKDMQWQLQRSTVSTPPMKT